MGQFVGLNSLWVKDRLSDENQSEVLINRIDHFSDKVLKELSKLDELLQIRYINQSVENIGRELEDTLLQKGVSSEVSRFLAYDIENIVHDFAGLADDETPFVSFRTLDQHIFPEEKSHVSKHRHIDTSVLTLACTYTGKTTQWINDENINRNVFKNNKIGGLSTVNPAKISHASINDILVLKGEIREKETERSLEFLEHFMDRKEVVPFNNNKGLIHRGPGFDEGDDIRTLLTLNTFKRPKWMLDHK